VKLYQEGRGLSANFFGGRLRGDVWTVMINDSWRSSKFTGYKIEYEVFEALIDAGVDTIVFVDPNRGRYTSSIEDWQEYSVLYDDFFHLRQSWMDYG
jgi:hypothetical protein